MESQTGMGADPKVRDLLLLSSSTVHQTTFLQHAHPALADTIRGHSLLFVPYALGDYDAYTAKVSEALSRITDVVTGIHRVLDPVAALNDAESVFIGGGNSFRLLKALQERRLVHPLRERVREGMPYIGSSAGTNMACPTLRTTNDMPIVEPPSFDALNLVPFQINPHYLDPDPSNTHMGETREARLLEFCEENDVPVLAIREGGWLRVRGDVAVLAGKGGARLFRRGEEPNELEPGTDVSFLLRVTPRFDASA